MKIKSGAHFLIETSAVPAALGFSSTPHVDHFDAEVAGASLCSSTYVRKEVLRRWVCEIIEFAQLMEMSSSVSNAISHLAEGFGRKPKLLGLIGTILHRGGIELAENDTHDAACEIAQIALDLVDMFDLKLKGRTNNTSGCKIGGTAVEVDGNNLLATLSVFRESFLWNVTDCPVNTFLQFKHPKGRTAKLVNCQHLDKNQEARDVRDRLKVLYERKAHVTCRECGRIGDQVIAMEQPASFTLIHVDRSFNHLCECTGRNHKHLRSNLSFKPPAAESAKEE